MIIDRLENTHLYNGLGARISKAFDYIRNTDFTHMKPGKYEIDGDLIFASLSEYSTKPVHECKLEGHHRYIDVQYVIKGEEQFGYTTLIDQEPSVPYNEEKDYAFYEDETSLMRLSSGSFAIFFPDDLHQPCIMLNKPLPVQKVVVKVKIS